MLHFVSQFIYYVKFKYNNFIYLVLNYLFYKIIVIGILIYCYIDSKLIFFD